MLYKGLCSSVLLLILSLTCFAQNAGFAGIGYYPCSVAAIIGTLTCTSTGTSQLTDVTTGGTWSSSTTTVATIGTAGLVTGVAAGTTTISYTLSAACLATAVFTVTAANGHTPSIAGYWAYYDASATNGYHVPSGTAVDTFRDLSGNGHHLVQATGTKQPAVSGTGTSTIITFDGTSDGLHTPTVSLAQPVTIIMVGNQITNSVNAVMTDGGANQTMNIQQTTSPGLILHAGVDGCTNNNMTINTTKVISAVFSGASSTLSINDGTKTTCNAGTSAPNGFSVGAIFNNNFDWCNMSVRYIIVYPSALSNADQTTLVAELRTYFGI